jgi:ribosomal protein S18 acetylase RimI-like enzyme
MVDSDTIKFIEVDETSKQFLDFLKLELKSNDDFTYFSNRTIDCLDNHLITILLLYKGDVAGYGHIDKENECWLGVYVSKNYRSISLGKKIIFELLARSQKLGLSDIVLSVFKTNIIAKSIYLNFGFEVYDENEKSFFMRIIL